MNRRSAIVNAITFARVPLIFAWMGLAIVAELRGVQDAVYWQLCGGAVVALVLSSLTDLYDGLLARRWGVVSTLGKLADPLMDKFFYVVAFPTLGWLAVHQGGNGLHELVLLAFAILYILRDLWVTFIRTVGALYGAPVAAMWMGKVRTAMSFPAAGWIYLYFVTRAALGAELGEYALWSCYAVEAIMMFINVLSIFTYTRVYWPYMRQAMGQ